MLPRSIRIAGPASRLDHHRVRVAALAGAAALTLSAFAGCAGDLRGGSPADAPRTHTSMTDASPGAAAAAAAAAADDAFTRDTDAWHQDRIATLDSDDGWLTLVTLAWLESGENRVGSDPAATVSYAGLPAAHVGTLIREGDDVRFRAEPGVSIDGVPADGVLRIDSHEDGPTVITVGRCSFTVIERGGDLAVRMRDPEAATRTSFEGIERFAVDPAWRIEADLVTAADDARVEVTSVIGHVEATDVAGRARFTHSGVDVDMVLQAAGDDAFFVVFADATNGDGSYPSGRFLRAERLGDDRVVLDFNRACNPPCAFTDFATCPLPVPSNRLPFPITAGERAPAGH